MRVAGVRKLRRSLSRASTKKLKPVPVPVREGEKVIIASSTAFVVESGSGSGPVETTAAAVAVDVPGATVPTERGSQQSAAAVADVTGDTSGATTEEQTNLTRERSSTVDSVATDGSDPNGASHFFLQLLFLRCCLAKTHLCCASRPLILCVDHQK